MEAVGGQEVEVTTDNPALRVKREQLTKDTFINKYVLKNQCVPCAVCWGNKDK